MGPHIIAIAIGLILDKIIGDPPNWPHPVRWIGNLISKLTALLNRGNGRKAKGFLLVFIVVGITFFFTVVVLIAAYSVHVIVGIALESILIASGLAQKSLKDAAMEVYKPLVDKDLPAARQKLSWIVGRDTEKLDEKEITRGVVETVSENISDGITAPLFYAFLFAGAPGLWAYKAINTLDSMVGYKNEKYEEFGYASAKLDDIANYIPSRMTGYIIILWGNKESTLPFKERMKGWWLDAKKHPSPNSGYLEAATAYQLGIQLGGINTYKGIISNRALMGIGEIPLNPSHILSTISHLNTAVFLFWLWLMVIGGVLLVIT
ncbi:cobalamin biosynthesis protein CobD [Bacillus sp. FJAT-22090]|uniref:adenosylcobinamide-phosphate synthase CbiB n=1 Tax=Bacillus sp. FJAT-22090 TaxID=1581038 RepID=UPI0006AFF014|nr:adenosylcobinamide-phosphate synthase CbiB [Bacillus sp. FJAT-22090]ALC86582.1 cobalamin biosynthesis protein CobD [Bacillus sp. FJAT-22090]